MPSAKTSEPFRSANKDVGQSTFQCPPPVLLGEPTPYSETIRPAKSLLPSNLICVFNIDVQDLASMALCSA
jgi:hypothetical protein